MTPRAAIQLDDNQQVFAPGTLLRGRAGWQSDVAPENVELRLFWFTKGRGTRDVDVLGEQSWQAPGASVLKDFSFTLPDGPYSFSGKLVSLIWALELVFQPGGHTERIEFTLSPGDGDIDLYRYPVPDDLKGGKKFTKRFTYGGS